MWGMHSGPDLDPKQGKMKETKGVKGAEAPGRTKPALQPHADMGKENVNHRTWDAALMGILETFHIY